MPRRKTSEMLPTATELWNLSGTLERQPALKMSGDPPVKREKDEVEKAPPIVPKD